jgi:hypothetical protein
MYSFGKRWPKVSMFPSPSPIQCTRLEGNYSSCTSRSSENICSSSGGGQEKGKTGQNRMKLSLKKWCLDCVMAGHDDDDYYYAFLYLFLCKAS